MQRPEETTDQLLYRMVMAVEKLEKEHERDEQKIRELSDEVLALKIRNDSLQKKLDNLSAGIGRGLWILGGGFLSAIAAWIAGGGLGK